LIKKNATISGAEGGCQAECGAGAAMAAAGIVELYGGTPEMAFDAAAIAIKSILGLVCDPVAGLVEVPCSKRNATGVVNAMACADMALAGIKSVIPFDEVVDAMYKIGKALPAALRETSLGGLATTPTGETIRCRLSERK
jgi:L-serine dehydratase